MTRETPDNRSETARDAAPHVLGEAPALVHIQDAPPLEEKGLPIASFREVLHTKSFRALWIAQVCSQLAQNFVWIVLGAFVAKQTGKATLVSITIVSAMLAQLLLSGFAGVIVDRTSKRLVLIGSNGIRAGLTLLFIAATAINDHDHTIQTTTIIILIFITNAVAQFFTPAEAATIPLLVDKKNLIAASSLFNITLNACQVVPFILALPIYALLDIQPVLLIVTVLYVVATGFVALLPAETGVRRSGPVAGSLREAGQSLLGDVREALHFLTRDPGLRLILFQINVAPTFLFIFGTLGLTFVKETFHLDPSRAWILIVPAGLGLMLGAAGMSRVAARVRKEDLINIGLIIMGCGVAVLGAVAVIVEALSFAATRVSHAVTGFAHLHLHTPSGHGVINVGLMPPAVLISFIIGLAMALSTIPAQTVVFERTSEEVRGRILSLQQLVGGAIPIIPLLAVAPLADIFGTSSVMTGLGIVIILVGAFSVHLDRSLVHQDAQKV